MHALNKSRPLRRIVLASAATVSGTVLLLALKPHTAPPLVTADTKSPAASSSSAPNRAAGTRTATGDSVRTRWGPVQVRVTVEGGELTDVTAVACPQDDPRDQEIDGYALPRLRREAPAAQSARIDSVSGATYTSDGYRQSLQSALDSAGL
ncbi:FMN-binding protein [Streptomyces cyanogenus]|uniref:FMN-binding domain protein n=1 Tax=Streptomyces cyanogenus TaxID=80860 RepID=A0ABX7TLD2_STRCY|nr:FMN-binding protein [Streptomyces cyanogenus]QTD97421.1 FMN-binding domain protein [Streptomyces cyanogenus]